MPPLSCLARLEDTAAKGTSERAFRRQEEALHVPMGRCQEVPTEPFLLFPVPSLSPDPLLVEAGEGTRNFLANDSFSLFVFRANLEVTAKSFYNIAVELVVPCHEQVVTMETEYTNNRSV